MYLSHYQTKVIYVDTICESGYYRYILKHDLCQFEDPPRQEDRAVDQKSWG